MKMAKSISRPQYVSFDCYGTLIYFDIATTTRRLIGDRLTEAEIGVFLRQFSKYRYDQVCGDFYAYEQVLHDAYTRTCAKWNLEVQDDAGAQLAAAVLTWGPHDDVLAPLKKMAEHFKLVILSNADDSFLAESVPRLGADFHAVYTAEQAQAYKPRYQAFEYMLDTLNAKPEDFLHVSSHTRYDMMPMHDMGFRSLVLLDRGYDPITAGYDYTTVESLDELNKNLGL
jgi:2-haloacid dehalogenase